MKYSDMDGNQKIAFRNTTEAYNDIVGGIINSIMDCELEDVPSSIDEIKEMVYDEAMLSHQKSMRFAGSEFVHKIIDKMVSRDEDMNIIKEAIENTQ